MDNVIKIVCPVCGSVLLVKQQPGLEKKSVTCPICKNINPFSSYKIKTDDSGEHTEYPGNNPGGEDCRTGVLSLVGSERCLRFEAGKSYIIGRQCTNNTADFVIPDSSKRMSRSHLTVEVAKVPGKGMVHKISLFKKEVNDTFINNVKLDFGDKVILRNKDLIKLPNAVLRFEIPDEDGTEI